MRRREYLSTVGAAAVAPVGVPASSESEAIDVPDDIYPILHTASRLDPDEAVATLMVALQSSGDGEGDGTIALGELEMHVRRAARGEYDADVIERRAMEVWLRWRRED